MKDFLWTLFELYAFLSITVISPLAIVIVLWVLRQVRKGSR